MNRHLRRALAAAAACLIGLGAVLVTSASASAAEFDIFNDAIVWEEADDRALEIDDASSYYTDLFGSGVDVIGWTGDAFDGFLFDLGVTDGVDTEFANLTPVSDDIVDGELSTIVATDTVALGAATVEVTVTLEIQGNYARWSITTEVSGGSDVDVWVEGELGSDSDSEFTLLSPTTLVSTDGPDNGSDPIIGYQLIGDGASFDVTDGEDYVVVDFPAGSTTSLVLALEDYDLCGRDAAVFDMTARVPTLNATFGATIMPADTRCVTIASPTRFSTSTTTDQALAVTDVSAANSDFAGETLDDWADDGDYLGEAELFTSGLPAGLTLGYDPVAHVLRLTGAAAPGTYTVRTALANSSVSSGDEGTFTVRIFPLFSTLTIEVTGPELAATGADEFTPTLAVFGGLLLLAGAAGLGATRVLRRR